VPHLQHLLDFFFGGDAESEREIRSDVFVKTRMYQAMKRKNVGLDILVAQKGVGKTYLLEELHNVALQSGNISLYATPSELLDRDIVKDSNIAIRSGSIFNKIVGKVALSLGKKIENTLISSGDKKVIYDYVKKCGEADSDVVYNFIKLVGGVLPHSKEISKVIMESSGGVSASKLAKSVSAEMGNSADVVQILIDDIDRGSVVSDLGAIRKIDYDISWAIIDAAYELSTKVPNVRIIVSVRSDVWHTMKRRKLGSDRRDKIKNIHEFQADRQEMLSILNRRTTLAAEKAKCKLQNPIECFFSGDVPLHRHTDEVRSWSSWLTRNSRNKPRDLVHLVEMLASDALGNDQLYINRDNIRPELMQRFAETRLENAYAEFEDICGKLNVVMAYILRHKWYDFDDLATAIKSSLAADSIYVDGVQCVPDHRESILSVLRVLHMASIVMPRVGDPGKPRGFDHVYFFESPDFVSDGNIINIEKSQWELHPVFHDIVDKNTQFSGDMASRGWKKKRH